MSNVYVSFSSQFEFFTCYPFWKLNYEYVHEGVKQHKMHKTYVTGK
jgi:hypothetical protein